MSSSSACSSSSRISLEQRAARELGWSATRIARSRQVDLIDALKAHEDESSHQAIKDDVISAETIVPITSRKIQQLIVTPQSTSQVKAPPVATSIPDVLPKRQRDSEAKGESEEMSPRSIQHRYRQYCDLSKRCVERMATVTTQLQQSDLDLTDRLLLEAGRDMLQLRQNRLLERQQQLTRTVHDIMERKQRLLSDMQTWLADTQDGSIGISDAPGDTEEVRLREAQSQVQRELHAWQQIHQQMA